MEGLIQKVEELKKSDIKNIIDRRISGFREFKKSSDEKIFGELCFCLLTSNYSAERAMRIQDAIGDGFITLPESSLPHKLKELGHRYPNARAGYIAEARKHMHVMGTILSEKNGEELREWLVKNVKGLGYKESSHFLRNVGFLDYAIIDFHIIDILLENGLLAERPKSLTKAKYLETEKVLGKISEKTGLSQGELDMYLWYLETGKILK